MFQGVISFIKELYGNQEFTPLAVPVFVGNEKKYLNECIDTTFVSSVGKFVDRFENDMAAYTGAKRAVVCVSGTNALHMALLLVDAKRNMAYSGEPWASSKQDATKTQVRQKVEGSKPEPTLPRGEAPRP